MSSKVLRPFALVGVLTAVVVAAAGCGTSSLSDAATVTYHDKSGTHTVHVDRTDFQKQLRQLTGNAKFRDFVYQQSGRRVHSGESTDTWLAATWLTQQIQQAAIDEVFKEKHLKTTAQDTSQARQQEEQNFGGKTTFAAFPKSFQDRVVQRAARLSAVLGSYATTPSLSEARRYFEAHKSEFGCASGKQVAHILVKDQATAQKILDQLKAGASFATLAKQQSTDTGSAQQGGNLGCLTPNAFVAEFQNAADAAPLNTPVGPVKTQFGYHVILVKPFANTFENARQQVLQALSQQAQQSATRDLTGRIAKLGVRVDPRYGKWGAVTNAQGQRGYQVSPPKTPKPRNQRETTTTAPTGTTQGGAP
jgi:parvulin-like peptidyl-prolyl isomerase